MSHDSNIKSKWRYCYHFAKILCEGGGGGGGGGGGTTASKMQTKKILLPIQN